MFSTGLSTPTTCTTTYDCASDKVCVNNSCVESAGAVMFDSIAKFATNNEAATYAGTTTTTYANLFTCVSNDSTDQLRDQQHHIWEGLVEYAATHANSILIDDNQATDTWGDRCESNGSNCSINADRYSECPDTATCVPKELIFPYGDGTSQVMDIYEPCGFTSNLAYYRVMPQLCDAAMHIDGDTSNALVHAFGALGAGSAIWHGSHTYLGSKADNQMIGVVSFLIHQIIIGGLAEANNLDMDTDDDLQQLWDLSNAARSGSAVDIANEVTNWITTRHVSEWADYFDNLDVPDYYETFTIIVASVLTILFPEHETTLDALLGGLASTFGADPAVLGKFLPKIRSMVLDLSLGEDQKFGLFRQLLAVGSKLVFAFLWQEQVLDNSLFQDPSTNAIASDIMPGLVSLFNFVSGFDYSADPNLQDFDRVFPGDRECRSTVPHSKWHELSAGGLLDMVYMADCTASLFNGSTSCATLPNGVAGKGEITQAQIDSWVKSHFASFPGIIRDILPVFISKEMTEIFDANGDSKVDWTDVVSTLDSATAISDVVGTIVDQIEEFISMFENFCTSDSECDDPNEFCNHLVFGCQRKKDNGFFPCLKDSQCNSGRCVDTYRTCSSKLDIGETCTSNSDCQSGTCSSFLVDVGVGVCGETCQSHGDCESGNWCNNNYSPQVCRPKHSDGFFPCISDDQCLSGQCSLGTCSSKKSKGSFCRRSRECASNKCSWFRCR